MFRQLIASLFSAALATLAFIASAEVRVVPGSGVAYMYFPAEGDSRSVIKIIKETSTGPSADYDIYFTFENEPEALFCASSETTCEKKLGAGKVRLRIAGDWAASNSAIDLAMHGKFSDACSAIDTSCELTTLAGESYRVSIKVDCDGGEHSKLNLGDGIEARCIDPIRNGVILIAAHQHIAHGKRPKNKKATWGYNSSDDGVANTQIIMDKWSGDTEESAAHYCNSLIIGTGKGKMMDWYLPAIDELDRVLRGWDTDDFTIPKDDDGYYSSTESGEKYTRVIRWSSSSGKQRTTEKYKYTDGATLCVHRVSLF